MIFFIVNIFVVILNEFLSAVKSDEGKNSDDHLVLDHLFDIIKSLIKLNKPRNTQGEGKISLIVVISNKYSIYIYIYMPNKTVLTKLDCISLD